MLKVGLTGGYATGKSLVAKRLETLGCHVIHADLLGHQVLARDGEGFQATLFLFGTEILGEDGTIDRRRLASIVFTDPEKLKQLNAIIHPAVFRREEQLMRGFELQDPRGIAVVEAAILLESRDPGAWDRIVVTVCGVETQITRAMERDHVTRDEARQRIARQMSDAERVRFAHYVIRTDGAREDTVVQVDRAYHELRQLAEAHGH